MRAYPFLLLSALAALLLTIAMAAANAQSSAPRSNVRAAPAPTPAAATLAQQPPAASARSWSVTLGAGAAFGPRYEGSDRFRATPIPVIEATAFDGLLYAGVRGVGVVPVRRDGFRVRLGVSYDFGRDEGDDRDNLNGLGDVDASALGVIAAEARIWGPLKATAEARLGLGGDYGSTGELGLALDTPITRTLLLNWATAATFADGEHMSARFGVTSAQSGRSGKSRYAAGAGVKSVEARVTAIYRLSESWGVRASLGVAQLVGDAADSPVTKDATQPSGLIAVTWRY